MILKPSEVNNNDHLIYNTMACWETLRPGVHLDVIFEMFSTRPKGVLVIDPVPGTMGPVQNQACGSAIVTEM